MLSLTAPDVSVAHRFAGLMLVLAYGWPAYAAETQPKEEASVPNAKPGSIVSTPPAEVKPGPVLAAKAPPEPAAVSEVRPPIFAPQAEVRTVPAGRPRLLPPGTRSRAISPEMSKRLSEMMERAAPPAAVGTAGPTPPVLPADGVPDALVMAPFVVHEDKEQKLREAQLLTPQERLALALRNNPGLKLGPLSLGNNAVALELLENKLEQQRRAELAELNSVLNAGGKKTPPELQRKIDEASTRKNDWLNQKPGTPFREPR